MGSRVQFRRSNGRFRRAPSLEEMGFDVAQTPRRCKCGCVWQPILVTGQCPDCGAAESEPSTVEELRAYEAGKAGR